MELISAKASWNWSTQLVTIWIHSFGIQWQKFYPRTYWSQNCTSKNSHSSYHKHIYPNSLHYCNFCTYLIHWCETFWSYNHGCPNKYARDVYIISKHFWNITSHCLHENDWHLVILWIDFSFRHYLCFDHVGLHDNQRKWQNHKYSWRK